MVQWLSSIDLCTSLYLILPCHSDIACNTATFLYDHTGVIIFGRFRFFCLYYYFLCETFLMIKTIMTFLLLIVGSINVDLDEPREITHFGKMIKIFASIFIVFPSLSRIFVRVTTLSLLSTLTKHSM